MSVTFNRDRMHSRTRLHRRSIPLVFKVKWTLSGTQDLINNYHGGVSMSFPQIKPLTLSISVGYRSGGRSPLSSECLLACPRLISTWGTGVARALSRDLNPLSVSSELRYWLNKTLEPRLHYVKYRGPSKGSGMSLGSVPLQTL